MSHELTLLSHEPIFPVDAQSTEFNSSTQHPVVRYAYVWSFLVGELSATVYQKTFTNW